tara:strand:- start:1027 stop:1425 length:399 start_codon:yes stop_codon:yes gene_type:complete
MPTEWTNNFNDDLNSTTVVTAIVKGNQATGTDLIVDNFTQYDVDGNPSLNWGVGDEFTLKNGNDDDHADVLYTITALSAKGLTGTAQEWVIDHTPTLAAQADNDGVITKEDSYKGNQRSAENHLRLRNQGQI